MIDARRDVMERRVLAQGSSAEEWAVEVTQPVAGVWTTTFYVGVQSFRLAEGDDEQSEEHCMFIGRMFTKALLRSLAVVGSAAEPPREPDHVLKSWPEFFRAAWFGDKPFEVRSTADRTFAVGQLVELREFIPDRPQLPVGYTGRYIRGIITHVLLGGRREHDPNQLKFEIPHGTCVFAYRVVGSGEGS